MDRLWWKIVVLLVLWLIAFIFVYKADGKENQYIPYSDYFLASYGAFMKPQTILEDRVRAIIISKAEEFDIDPKILLTLARCESQFDPKAKNPISSASGLFQFVRTTWNLTIKEMNRLDFNIFNPAHNTEAAAYLIKKDGIRHWLASKDCWQDFQ